MARKKPAGPDLPLAGPVRPPCMVEGCPGVSHLHGLCEAHWARPVPLLLFSVTTVEGRWEAAAWRSGGDPAFPEWVELFDTEGEARTAAEAYLAEHAP